ncbi:LysR family transcriptional regulator [Streptomyces olivochromogenes]|uniref:LysR family transcriptional regulator n=1 Tax=Streptomyces olivochromogenes TaxID=1963 RepID=UPI001F3F45BD|nr:LysR family transcriptional regulator [Streptomyces olivochromogenes]MCF3134669.1 LysR family transcriptional regulator [Streptomyces olivochromogenes]
MYWRTKARRISPASAQGPCHHVEVPLRHGLATDLRARLSVRRPVYRYGRVGKAASLLGLSQPTVARHLKTLERSTGRQLFDRRTRGVAPASGAGILLAARLATHAGGTERPALRPRPAQTDPATGTRHPPSPSPTSAPSSPPSQPAPAAMTPAMGNSQSRQGVCYESTEWQPHRRRNCVPTRHA